MKYFGPISFLKYTKYRSFPEQNKCCMKQNIAFVNHIVYLIKTRAVVRKIKAKIEK